MSEQYTPNLHGTYEQPPMNSADRSRRRTKYRRIRSTARDNYMQNCGYGRPPLPQNLAPTQSITNGDRTDNSDEGSSIGRGGYSSARERSRSRDRESAVGRETDRDRERPGPSSALPDRHGYGPRSQQTPQDYSGGVISTQPRSQHGKKSIPRRHTVGGSGLLSQQEIQKV